MEMQVGQEIEGVMEKAWDLHDKMSDAISTLSKSHFLLNSIHHHHETTAGSEKLGSFIHIPNTQRFAAADDEMQEKAGEENQVAETISLNTIRRTLEALENQLHFLHIQQSQRPERDATLTQLEEGRLILLRRLTEHHGRQWDFIQEALAFATYRGEEEDPHVRPSSFLYPTVATQLDGAVYSEKKMIFDEKIGNYQKNSFNGLRDFLSISIQFLKNSGRLYKIAGVMAKAALVAVGMLGILGMPQMGQRRTKKDPFHEKSRAHMNNNQFEKKHKFRSIEDNFQKHTTSERMELPSHLQPNNLNVIFGRG